MHYSGLDKILRTRAGFHYRNQPENRGNIPENYLSPAEKEREGELKNRGYEEQVTFAQRKEENGQKIYLYEIQHQ